jgi:hypothetical protein
LTDSSGRAGAFRKGGWLTERRAFNRIPAYIGVHFFFGNSLCSGTIKNLSENGMLVDTKICFPLQSRFDILFPLKQKEDSFNIPAEVSRVIKEGSFYDAMGVKVVYQPHEYLEYVTHLKAKQLTRPLVVDKTAKQATQCLCNFKCLTHTNTMCLIDKPVNGNVLRIKKRSSRSENCPFLETTEDAFTCSCPTRNDIFMQYYL